MFVRSPLLLVPLLLAGCLQEGPVPKGVHLFHSQTLAAPGFMTVAGETVVRFEDRKFPTTSTRGALADLWISSFDGMVQRKVVTNWSPSLGEEGPDRAGGRYYMVNERLLESGGGMTRVADMVRLGRTMEEELRLEGVWTKRLFTVPIRALYAAPEPGQSCPGSPGAADDCPQIYFERPIAPGQQYPTLLLWNGEEEIPLGPDSGAFQVQVMGNGTMYFLLGQDQTLTRFVRPSNVMESVRAHVAQFQVSGDERYAAVRLSEAGTTKVVVLDLVNKTEISLARPNPSGGWTGLDGERLTYTQLGGATEPAELHTLDLRTGEDTFITLPSPLRDLVAIRPRWTTDERLLLDSAGQGVFTNNDDWVGKRVVHGPLYTPGFTPDGRYLVYIQRAASTLNDPEVRGALMFQDAELALPPAMISAPGLLVRADGGRPDYDFIEDASILVFWAHLGRGSSDLYFADYPGDGLPTHPRMVARAILSVSFSSHSLFGIVNMSQQDAVGDLVARDLDTGAETLYAKAVSEVSAAGAGEFADLPGPRSAYIVRGRAPSDRSGLWLTGLAPPKPPAAAF